MVVTGFYYKSNVLKTLIMVVVYTAEHPPTCREIAEKLGISVSRVSFVMNHYQKQENHKYFRRLKPLKGTIAYRYKIMKSGEHYMWKYLMRMHEGFDLSLCRRVPAKTPQYEIARAKAKADWEWRHKILAETGYFPPKHKPTKQELLDIKPELLSYYIGITKQGALEMGLTEATIH